MEEADEDPLWKKFLEKLKEPMIALLLASAGVSLLTGQYDDAISIAIVRVDGGGRAGGAARERRAARAQRVHSMQRPYSDAHPRRPSSSS